LLLRDIAEISSGVVRAVGWAAGEDSADCPSFLGSAIIFGIHTEFYRIKAGLIVYRNGAFLPLFIVFHNY
jgi:hypothetical protein